MLLKLRGKQYWNEKNTDAFSFADSIKNVGTTNVSYWINIHIYDFLIFHYVEERCFRPIFWLVWGNILWLAVLSISFSIAIPLLSNTTVCALAQIDWTISFLDILSFMWTLLSVMMSVIFEVTNQKSYNIDELVFKIRPNENKKEWMIFDNAQQMKTYIYGLSIYL